MGIQRKQIEIIASKASLSLGRGPGERVGDALPLAPTALRQKTLIQRFASNGRLLPALRTGSRIDTCLQIAVLSDPFPTACGQDAGFLHASLATPPPSST